ncbi:MAG: chromate transporter [Spirochaetaceae bacterium]|jgi:chromate transporter|nr:chromate transporter [Spirochaetaceae bacterium]
MKKLFELFFIFAKIGCMTFGGGYAILPIIEREMIRKRGWTNIDELLRYYTIAQVTPGIISVNVATFIGYKRNGILGGIIATLGFALPSLTMIIVLACTLNNFSDLPIIQHCFSGLRIAVGALILDTVCKFFSKNLLKKELSLIKNIVLLLIFIASFLLSVIFQTNPVLIVISAGLCGFLFFGNQESRLIEKPEEDTGEQGSPKNPPTQEEVKNNMDRKV